MVQRFGMKLNESEEMTLVERHVSFMFKVNVFNTLTDWGCLHDVRKQEAWRSKIIEEALTRTEGEIPDGIRGSWIFPQGDLARCDHRFVQSTPEPWHKVKDE